MNFCNICGNSVAHFKDATTSTLLCSKSCHQVLIDEFYKLKPQQAVNPEGIITYNDNGLVVTLYDKKAKQNFEYVDQLLLTGWTQSYFCGRTLSNRYLPLTILDEKYRWAVIGSAAYDTPKSKTFKEGVLGALVATENATEKNTVTVDLLCSPHVVMDKSNDEKKMMSRKKRELLSPSKEDAFQLSLGSVIMDGFLSYIFNKTEFTMVDLTALTSDLIPYYARFGFVLYPTTKSDVFIDNGNSILAFGEEEELSNNPSEWYQMKVMEFQKGLENYNKVYQYNKQNNIPVDTLKIEDYISNELLFFSGIEKQGYYMRLTREDYLLKNKQPSIPKAIPESIWDRLIIKVDPYASYNYYQTYLIIKPKMKEYEKTYSEPVLDAMLEEMFARGDLSNKRLSEQEIRNRIEKIEKRELKIEREKSEKKKLKK